MLSNQKPFVILPDTRAYFALASLLSVGAAAILLTAILAIAALAGLTVFIAILGWHLLLLASSTALASGPLTQVLLIVVFSYVLSKVYPALWKAVQAALDLLKRGN